MSVIRVRRSTISRPTSPSSTETAPNPSTSTTDNESLPTVVGPIRRRATISERFFSPPPPNPPTAAVGSSSPTLAGAAEGEGEGEGGLIPPLPLLSPGVTRSRRSSYLPSGVGVVALSEGEGGGGGEEHGEDEVDLLDVLDPSIATTMHLSNISSAFFPASLSRAPLCDLDNDSEESPTLNDHSFERDRDRLGAEEYKLRQGEMTIAAELENEDPLAKHLRKLLRKQKRKENLKSALKGLGSFLRTPLGVFFAIYGFLVVVFGAGLVLLLMIPMNAYEKTLWVEICAQVLTALFTITGIGLFPNRLRDMYWIGIIAYYARQIRLRRLERGLIALVDQNDLPELAGVGVGRKGDETLISNEDVLTPTEANRLHSAQIKFAGSQTWYRMHETPTHHAFPIPYAFLIALLIVGNSIFQACLCGVMWGMNRFTRPAWVTAFLIVCSFGCGVGGAVLIGILGERTKKKKEVSRRIWAMLKSDEEAMKLEQMKGEHVAEAEGGEDGGKGERKCLV